MAYIKIRLTDNEDEKETVVEIDLKGIDAEYEYNAINGMTRDIIKCLNDGIVIKK